MSDEARAIVVLADGRLGSAPLKEVRERKGRVRVTSDDGCVVEAEASSLRPLDDGRFALDVAVGGRPETVIPLVAEELEVGTRVVETGRVVVRKTVTTREEVVDPPLFREEVEVRRVAVDRAADGPEEPRREGDVLIVPIVEEVLVVEKRFRVREELHIIRRRVEDRAPITVSLRAETAAVERVPAVASSDRDPMA